MNILLIIVVAFAIIVFGLLITGLIIIWRSESKKIQQTNVELDASEQTIAALLKKVEKLQTDIKAWQPKDETEKELLSKYTENMPKTVREFLRTNGPGNPGGEIDAALRQANVSLKAAHKLGLPRRERLGTYFYTCFQLFCLALKTLVVAGLFGVLCALFLGLSLSGVAIILGGAGYPLSEVCCILKVEYVQCIQYALPAGYATWAALGLVIVVGLVLAVVFLQKVTKLLFIFCDILFENTRICMRIVCAEKFDRARIIQDITLLTRSVERKNSSGFFNNFLTRFED